jgi:hypothetical protein
MLYRRKRKERGDVLAEDLAYYYSDVLVSFPQKERCSQV